VPVGKERYPSGGSGKAIIDECDCQRSFERISGRQRDGLYRWHIARAVALRDENGSIIRWIGTNTDIEEQKSTSESRSSEQHS
jgi:PAS domain-containing protein